ncbi:MAG: hypothetical protein AVDCRST_MAG85-1824 [uncultured Solirubrobacteraceae bacterium]|uniref:Uncharacterized protein n=1 Tax=uncultured Solirubrobacteraceae bacterium TaxID=1162706 RepID=A0A6J4SNF5_9ACTN|nr:MAG: hypothetical protein AVDCRST_MAG85-1824 [uncultured Solirubrobacteraceae bacterium]
MLRWTVPLLVALLLAGDATAQQGRYEGSRPHSVARIRDRDGVAVTRIEAKVRRVGSQLEVRVVLDAHLRRGTSRAAALHVLSCTGTTDYPDCPNRSPRRIALAPQSRTTAATVRVAVPPPKTDAIVVALTRPPRYKHGSDPTTYAYLQIQGEGWRGRGAGRSYGAVVEPLDGFDVHELHFDGIGLGPKEARAAVMWSVSSEEPARVRWDCTVGPCGDSFRLKGDGRQNGEGPLDRTEFTTEGSPTLGMVGMAGNRRLFSVRVPTPVR